MALLALQLPSTAFEFTHAQSLLEKDLGQAIPITWLNNWKIDSVSTINKLASKQAAQDFTRRKIAWIGRLQDKVLYYKDQLQGNHVAMQQRGEYILKQFFAIPNLIHELREIGMDVVSEYSLSFTFYLPNGRLHINTYTNFEDDPDDTTADYYAVNTNNSWQWEGPANKLEKTLQQASFA